MHGSGMREKDRYLSFFPTCLRRPPVLVPAARSDLDNHHACLFSSASRVRISIRYEHLCHPLVLPSRPVYPFHLPPLSRTEKHLPVLDTPLALCITPKRILVQAREREPVDATRRQKRREGKCSKDKRTLRKPMSWLFSRKH